MKKLIEKKNKIKEHNNASLQEFQTRCNAEFEKLEWIKGVVSKLEDSRDFGYDEGVYSWIRCEELSEIPEEIRGEFQEYMSENHFVQCDFEHNSLQYSLGHNIIINDDGDVFDEDSAKFIIGKDEYQEESELHSLIESWMENKGYFPGVYRMDRYCNVFPVNTKE